MTVNMRKEQVLLLVVVLLGGWLAYGYWDDTYKRTRPRQNTLSYDATIPYTPFLANPKDDPGLGDDIFLEPSETRPLPPRDLPFPQLDDLPPVAPPMPIGQQAGAFRDLLLRIPVAKVVKGAAPVAPAAVAPVNGQGANAGTVQDPLSPEQLARRYDRLIMLDGNKYWGFFVGSDEEKYKLANGAGPYPAKLIIRFRWINERSGKQISLEEPKGDKVKQLDLAKTIKNDVGKRDQRVPWTASGLTQQVDFLLWLIQQGRREAWVFTKAMQACNKHIECARRDVDAYRLKVRVLRAQGSLEGEWRLYQELPEKLKESAFRYQGMGEVQALLGLRKLAEKNLRKAVQLGPTDPRTHGALARFLLSQGRPQEAVVEADLARRDRRRLGFADEKLQLDRTVVAAHLATGDTEGAKAALPVDLPVELTDQRRFLDACVSYAEGDLAKARSDFEACVASGQVPDAAFGVAACQLRQGEVVAARDGFAAVADQNPRLRHLALAGKGLALERIDGQQSAALEALSAAHEANPTHPYILYLLGRERRRTGNLDGAVEVLKEALAQRDDFQEALAELTLAYERIYHRDTDASALSHAVKYSDRLVSSEAASLNGTHKPTPLYRELQGWLHFQAGDYRGAREAFEKGQEQSEFCKIGLAIVTYKQKKYEEARDILGEIRARLPLHHEKRVFAKKLVELMDAHDNLEQIQVTFDGERLPKSWKPEVAGRVHPRVKDGVLRIQGELRGSRSVVMAYRELPGTGRFVSLDLEFQNKEQNPLFAGLEINNARNDRRGGDRPPDFMARFGLNRDGVLFLQIVDGRNPKPEEREPVLFREAVVHKDRMNHMRLEAVPQKDDQNSKNLLLRASWNGEKLYERKLKRLRRGAGKGGKLNLQLKVVGKGRTKVDTVFDNFRLVQIRGDK